VPPRRGWWLRRRWSLLLRWKGLLFSSMIAALSLKNIYPEFSPGNKVHKYYFGVWTLSGLRMWFVARNKRGGCLSLRWFRPTN
jgi:hypothetical protein